MGQGGTEYPRPSPPLPHLEKKRVTVKNPLALKKGQGIFIEGLRFFYCAKNPTGVVDKKGEDASQGRFIQIEFAVVVVARPVHLGKDVAVQE